MSRFATLADCDLDEELPETHRKPALEEPLFWLDLEMTCLLYTSPSPRDS